MSLDNGPGSPVKQLWYFQANLVAKQQVYLLHLSHHVDQAGRFEERGPLMCSPRQRDDVAIIGMSGRFPGADDLESFWGVLKDGHDVHEKVRMV